MLMTKIKKSNNKILSQVFVTIFIFRMQMLPFLDWVLRVLFGWTINALRYKGEIVNRNRLAEEAAQIEIEILKAEYK